MNKLVIIIIAAVLVLALIGTGIYFFFIRDGGDEEKPINYYEYQYPEQYANLASEDNSTKILKFQMTVEYTNQEIAPLFEKHATRIMNDVLEYFGDLDFTEANQQDAREDLREILIEILESDEETITNIYLVPFIMQ